MSSLIAIALFVAIAFPISLVFSPIGDAPFVAPLVAFCMAIISCAVELILNIGLMNAYILVACSLTSAGLVNRKSRSLMIVNSNSQIRYFDVFFIGILILFGIGFLIHVPPPLAWDARSIWLFHASWIADGATTFSNGQNLESLSFSHPSYPLGGAAAMAIVWLFSGSQENLLLGVRVIALLTLTNSILAVKILMIPFARKVQSIGFILLSLILVTVIFLSVNGLALSGYMDILLASLIGVAAAALLSIAYLNSDSNIEIFGNRFLWIAALSVFAAVNVKQEGIFFSLVLIFSLGLVYFRNRLYFGILLGFAGTSFLLWKLVISVAGGTNESDASGISANLPELLDPHSIAWNNFSIIWNGYFKNYLVFPNLIFIVAVLAFLMNPLESKSLKVPIFAFVAWMGNWMVIFAPYMLGQTRENLAWWLDTSFSRVVSSQLVFTVVFCGFVLANSFKSSSTDMTDLINTKEH